MIRLRSPAVGIVLCFTFAWLSATATAEPATIRGLGSLDFPVATTSPAAKEAFIRGMLLLHLFEYPAAAKYFQAAESLDPNLAMAYWGEAMTSNHPVWNQLNLPAGQAALKKFAPSLPDRAARLKDPRERAWFAAVEILYENSGTKHERDLRYAAAMEALHHTWPDDESSLFLALATLGKSEGVRDLPEYLKAAAIARAVYAHSPDHPGAAHYWIHGMDDPQHAAGALVAARALSHIAPDAGHAQHMCSHIFMALGMWPEVVEANENAMRVVDEGDRAAGVPSLECGHYGNWLEYAYLQQGRIHKADELLQACIRSSADLAQFRSAHGGKEAMSRYTTPEMLKRVQLEMRDIAAIESQAWTGAAIGTEIDSAGLGSDAASDAFAQGFAQAGAGDLASAREALKRLSAAAATHDAADPYAQSDQVNMKVMADNLAASIAAREGHLPEAIAAVRQTAATFDRQPFDFGPPVVLKPPQELLGELLLAKGDAKGAVVAFGKSLDAAPNRSLSLLGLARSQSTAGDKAAARQTWSRLLLNWNNADPALLLLAEARAAVKAP